jgi:DNA-binding response OmpR family regulator
MPNMGGHEVCGELKKDKNTKEIPIVMLTSEGSRESVKNAYQAGADDYIVKPIILAMLLTKMDKFLSKH